MLSIIQILKNPKYLLILIIIFTTLTRFIRLDFPNKYVFDEVYHAFTAKEYLKWNKEAWEWWTTPPPKVAYEWTHPPLAKEIMAASMFLVRSQDAWVFRLPGVLLGILSVYLVYLLGLKLLKHQTASLIAAFVFSLDGLNFVQSRVSMNDIYYVTFVLASLVFLLRKNYAFSSMVFGLALSSKWAAIYFILIIVFLLFDDRQMNYPAAELRGIVSRKFLSHYIVTAQQAARYYVTIKKLILFILIPTVIYLLSYLPFFLLGHNLTQFIELQQQMWWYHTGLKATHGYSSSWWSWPLNLYPVWYFVDYQKNSIANIFAFGNPVVFWAGTVAIILTGLEIIKKRSLNLSIIVLGFLIFWLPWALSPRIMFLYHFSPSVPFLSLALGYQLGLLFTDSKNRQLVIILLILMALSFILIFPFLTGIPIPKNFVNLFFLTNLGKNPF